MPTMMFSSSLSDGMGSDEEPREEDEDLKLVSSKLSDSSLRLGSEGSLRLRFLARATAARADVAAAGAARSAGAA